MFPVKVCIPHIGSNLHQSGGVALSTLIKCYVHVILVSITWSSRSGNRYKKQLSSPCIQYTTIKQRVTHRYMDLYIGRALFKYVWSVQSGSGITCVISWINGSSNAISMSISFSAQASHMLPTFNKSIAIVLMIRAWCHKFCKHITFAVAGQFKFINANENESIISEALFCSVFISFIRDGSHAVQQIPPTNSAET